jgi:membrane-associated phospholipid phosphatase
MTEGRSNPRKSLLIVGGFFSLAVFVFLALQVVNAGPVTRFDLRCAEDLKDHAETHETMLTAMRIVTHVGGVPVMTGLAILGALVLLARREYALALFWVVAAGGGCLVNLGVKAWIERERPPLELRDDAVTETNESFPSGHSMGSTIGYGSLAYVLSLKLRRRAARVWIVAGLTVLVVLIGFSRMYLRAHWFSDVLGGFGLGGFWLGMCVGVSTFRRPPLAA